MKRRTLAAGAALTVALTAITTELALPSVAENRVRDRLASFGSVTDVEVSSSPAVGLLFGKVDSASIRMSSATLDGDAVDPDLLHRAGDIEAVDARIDSLHAGPFDVDTVVLDKRGDALEASATLQVDQVESLVPGAELTVRKGRLVLNLAELPLPLPMPGGLQLEIGLENGMVVARALGAASALLPPQPLLARPELSVNTMRSSIDGGQVSVTATGTLHEA